MIEYVRSNVDGRICHILFTTRQHDDSRVNISPENERLQIAAIKLRAGQTFQAHKHLPTKREIIGTSESWVVVSGRVRAILYDTDDSILKEVELGPGDLTFTICGGHNYVALCDDTFVYEFKNGPYLGNNKDKVLI